MSERLAQHFAAMRDYINKHGFQSGIGEDGGPRCYLGAHLSVMRSTHCNKDTDDSNPEWDVLRKLIDPDPLLTSTAFAAPRQNATEAMALLTTAIAMLRARSAVTPETVTA